METTDGPRMLPVESGVVRYCQPFGVERKAAIFGGWCGFMMLAVAWYGTWEALYGWPLVVGWFWLWKFAAKRDPQYAEILWRAWVTRPIPVRLQAAPGALAKRVKIEACVPVRG